MKLRVAAVASLLVLASCGSNESQDVAAEGGEAGAEASVEEVVPIPAGGHFAIQPGLWERTVKNAAGTTPPVDRICIDESTRNLIAPVNEVRGVAGGCTPIQQTENSFIGVAYGLRCTQPEPVEVNGVVRLKDNEIKTDINVAKAGGGDLIFTGQGTTRRIGECPAGMKPGDVSDQSGKVTGSLKG